MCPQQLDAAPRHGRRCRWLVTSRCLLVQYSAVGDSTKCQSRFPTKVAVSFNLTSIKSHTGQTATERCQTNPSSEEWQYVSMILSCLYNLPYMFLVQDTIEKVPHLWAPSMFANKTLSNGARLGARSSTATGAGKSHARTQSSQGSNSVYQCSSSLKDDSPSCIICFLWK